MPAGLLGPDGGLSDAALRGIPDDALRRALAAAGLPTDGPRDALLTRAKALGAGGPGGGRDALRRMPDGALRDALARAGLPTNGSRADLEKRAAGLPQFNGKGLAAFAAAAGLPLGVGSGLGGNGGPFGGGPFGTGGGPGGGNGLGPDGLGMAVAVADVGRLIPLPPPPPFRPAPWPGLASLGLTHDGHDTGMPCMTDTRQSERRALHDHTAARGTHHDTTH